MLVIPAGTVQLLKSPENVKEIVQYAPEQTGVGLAAIAVAGGLLIETEYRKETISEATTNLTVRSDFSGFFTSFFVRK
jgi:hypothetical protein